MKNIIESKVRFTEGGDVYFKNPAAQHLYDQMFKQYSNKVRELTKPLDFKNLEESMKEPSPYTLAEQAGYKWGLEMAETPEYMVKIEKQPIKTSTYSSYHTATFYKK